MDDEDEFSTTSGTRDGGQYGSLAPSSSSSSSSAAAAAGGGAHDEFDRALSADEHDPLVALVKTYERTWSSQHTDAEAERQREEAERRAFFQAQQQQSPWNTFPFRTAMVIAGFVLMLFAVVYTRGTPKTQVVYVYGGEQSTIPPPPLPAVAPNPPDTKQTDNPPVIPPPPAVAEPEPEPEPEPAVVVVVNPTERPTLAPTPEPTWPPEPTKAPTQQPTMQPEPTPEPTEQPTAPSPQPTGIPTPEPTSMPTPTMAAHHRTREPSVGPSHAPVTSHPSATPTHQPTRTPPPNVVFVMADDMGYQSLNADLTPFLMSMRANGVALGKYYTQEVKHAFLSRFCLETSPSPCASLSYLLLFSTSFLYLISLPRFSGVHPGARRDVDRAVPHLPGLAKERGQRVRDRRTRPGRDHHCGRASHQRLLHIHVRQVEPRQLVTPVRPSTANPPPPLSHSPLSLIAPARPNRAPWHTAPVRASFRLHPCESPPMRHTSPVSYLPTARGFDYFLGYLDGFTNYWSKTDPTAPTYKDECGCGESFRV